MALLNYADLRSKLPGGIEGLLNQSNKPTYSNGADTVGGDWAKIFFTGEGDIITHGRNYTHEFVGGVKGLVPDSSEVVYTGEGKRLHFLDNTGKWTQLEVGQLPMAGGIYDGRDNNGDKLLYSAKQVYDFFQAELSATDAMRFKGGVNPNDLTNFPKDKKCEIGDTYRVTESGDYAGYELRVGDLLICIKEANNVTADDVDSYNGTEGKSEGEYWMVVESNINGTITHFINNQQFEVYTPNTTYTTETKNKTWLDIYAPVTGGKPTGIGSGEVLVSTGLTSAPVWVDVEEKDFINSTLKAQIGATFNVSNEGDIKVTALNGSTVLLDYIPEITQNADGSFNHDWRINIKGKAAATKFGMTTDTGLQFFKGEVTKDKYDGSEDLLLRLMPAQRAEGMIGGVIVDYRTNIAPELSELPDSGESFRNASTISVTDKGMIYLSYANICNALGFEPGKSNELHNYGIVLADAPNVYEYPSGSLSVDNPHFNLTSVNEDKTVHFVAGSIQFVGNESIKVTGANEGAPQDLKDSLGSQVLIQLQTATPSILGGVRVAKNNNAYAVNALTSNISADITVNDKHDKFYGVELDKNGKAFVYVPWEDTGHAWKTIAVQGGEDKSQHVNVSGTSGNVVADLVEDTLTLIAGHGINLVADPDNDAITINSNVWEVVKPTKIGYAPAMVESTNSLSRDYFVLSYIPGAAGPSWNQVPWEATKDTWRDIKVNGESWLDNTGTVNGVITGKTINFAAPTTDNNKTTLIHAIDEETREATLNIFSTWRDIYLNDKRINRDYGFGLSDTEDMVIVEAELDTADGKAHYAGYELAWWNYSTNSREVVNKTFD